MSDETRIEIFSCAFCPLAIDGICIPYQVEINPGEKKPEHCRYKALILGNDGGT